MNKLTSQGLSYNHVKLHRITISYSASLWLKRPRITQEAWTCEKGVKIAFFSTQDANTFGRLVLGKSTGTKTLRIQPRTRRTKTPSLRCFLWVINMSLMKIRLSIERCKIQGKRWKGEEEKGWRIPTHLQILPWASRKGNPSTQLVPFNGINSLRYALIGKSLMA